MLEPILMLLLYCLLGFMTATLGLCFEHFTRPNMIFNWYHTILKKWASKSKFGEYITKPLGLCPYCSSTWISIVVFIHFFDLNITILLFIGVVWFFVHLINTKLPI